MSDLVGNPKDRFSRVAARLLSGVIRIRFECSLNTNKITISFESRHEKTNDVVSEHF